MIDRSPTLIVQPETRPTWPRRSASPRGEGLPIAVRGGGHNVAGLAVCDDGLMIDLSRMRAVEVDPAGKTARAQGGATWGDFDAATQAHGLATTGGAISMTGIGGLTLGGGLGNLMRSYGLTMRQPDLSRGGDGRREDRNEPATPRIQSSSGDFAAVAATSAS